MIAAMRGWSFENVALAVALGGVLLNLKLITGTRPHDAEH